MMDNEIVVVETTSGVIEAEILRGLLMSSGITVWLSHESAAKVYGLGVGPLSQVDLVVPVDQAQAAREILADYHAGRLIDDDEGA